MKIVDLKSPCYTKIHQDYVESFSLEASAKATFI